MTLSVDKHTQSPSRHKSQGGRGRGTRTCHSEESGGRIEKETENQRKDKSQNGRG